MAEFFSSVSHLSLSCMSATFLFLQLVWINVVSQWLLVHRVCEAILCTSFVFSWSEQGTNEGNWWQVSTTSASCWLVSGNLLFDQFLCGGLALWSFILSDDRVCVELSKKCLHLRGYIWRIIETQDHMVLSSVVFSTLLQHTLCYRTSSHIALPYLITLWRIIETQDHMFLSWVVYHT